MLKFIAILATCLLAFVSQMQGQIIVSGSHVQDSTGALVSNATISFAPVDNSGNAISYRINGANGGQSIFSPASATVTNGAFSLSLPDTSTTQPQNVCFSVKITDNVTGNSLLGSGYSCVQPTSVTNGWCSGSTCNFDNYSPGLASLPLTSQVTCVSCITSGSDASLRSLSVADLSTANYSYASIDTFGNSLVQGTGATTFMSPGIKGRQTCWPGDIDYAATCFANGPTAFAYLLAADFGNSGHNFGRGGDADPDVSFHVALHAHPTLEYNPVRVGLEATNDTSLYGTNTDQQDTVTKAVLFEIAQATIPDSLKTPASTCTQTGTWTADTAISGALTSTTSGSSLTCAVTSSAPYVYVAYEKCDNTNSGTASVTINGVAGSLEPTINFFGLGNTAIYTGNGTSIATGSGQFSHCSLALARNTATVGSNTMTLTSTNGGKVEVLWVASPYLAPANAIAPPLYIQAGAEWEQGDTREPASGQFNVIDQQAVTLMASDGNNVRFADVRAYMNDTTDYTGGGGSAPDGQPWRASWSLPLHPGDSGHYHIYQAIRDQIKGQPKPSQALCLWGGSNGSICGSESINGRYGDDDGYNTPGTSTILTIDNKSFASMVGINFKQPNLQTYTLGYWQNNQWVGAMANSWGLYDNANSIFAFKVNALNDDFCTSVAGTSNSGCLGASLYSVSNGGVEVSAGAQPNPHNLMGIATTNSADLKVGAGTYGDLTPRLMVTQENSSASHAPELWMVNMAAPSGQHGVLQTLDNAGGWSMSRCSDDRSSCASLLGFPGASAVGNTYFNFVGQGLNLFTLGGWTSGSGNGAGIAGVVGLFDATTSTFAWNTNSTDDVYFHTPLSGGNVSAGTGSAAGISHAGVFNGSGYSVNGTAGYTGTKTAGSCVFTISGGIITAVTGC